MKKVRSIFLGILGLSVILILATGCYRPAARDVTPTPSGAEAATPGEPDLAATAIVNTTRAAQTVEAQTAEAQPAGEGEEPAETSTQEPAETSTEPPAETSTAPSTQATTPPPPTATTEPPTPTPIPTAGETTYVVQPGDNLFRIALRYGTSVQAIAQANGIANVSQISVGQELTIPAGGQPSQPPASGATYVVQPGDNLFRIALRYNMSYQRLAEYNGITNPANIYVGQVLRIPPQ